MIVGVLKNMMIINSKSIKFPSDFFGENLKNDFLLKSLILKNNKTIFVKWKKY